MTTRVFGMPKTNIIGKVDADGNVRLNPVFHSYFGGLEDVSKRVSAYVDPDTATLADLIAALIAANSMKAE